MVRLLLIRHAATAWTAQGRFQGQTDVPLSPYGRRQAAAPFRSPIDSSVFAAISSARFASACPRTSQRSSGGGPSDSGQ